jgi:hypothetical protein
MRPHQWLKNLLLLVPLVAAHRISEVALLATALLAFVSFSLCASSAYVVNDLLDLRADRHHPRKRLRPLASGALSVQQGLGLSLVLVACGLGLGAIVSMAFLGVVALYYALTLAYSLANQEPQRGGHHALGRPLHAAHHRGWCGGPDRPDVLAARILDVRLPESGDREALLRNRGSSGTRTRRRQWGADTMSATCQHC